jgi:CBS-domain-containing membrane protein
MVTSLDRLRSLRVADAMNRQVVPIAADQTMRQAAAVFKEHQISGAPVVDHSGRCVGMLSAADFVSPSDSGDADDASPRTSEGAALRRAPDGRWEVHDLSSDRVSARMTSAVQSVAAGTSLVDAARIMCSQHIHRLPVLDAEGHPRGMLTSLDIVAALVQAVDEAQSL